ncbi:MAG: hypothetical protein KDK36_19735 [Leptospiraceae bacterium]|nr:hypothetical protein [Leptospiraceae bacterium]
MAEEKEKKNKKVTKMKLPELEQALKKAEESGNIDTSHYVQHLKLKIEEVKAKAS